jgi:hypothetical protein
MSLLKTRVGGNLEGETIARPWPLSAVAMKRASNWLSYL